MGAATSYKTKQRDQIMNCLIKNKDRHITAEEILFDLNGEKPLVGKTTIYRYLDKLVAQGVVRKYYIEEGKSACYQYAEQNGTCENHFHLKCVNCGKLFHLKCDYLCDVESHIKNHHDFQVDSSKTVLYGRCGSCTGKHGGSGE
jgi:Fe2+/Zn2+ uptake regulation proteins